MARPTDEPKTYRLDLRFPEYLVNLVDEWRRLQPDIPARAEAIRRLVLSGVLNKQEMMEGFLRVLIDLHAAGRLSEDEWSRVQEVISGSASQFAEDHPSLVAVLKRLGFDDPPEK